MKRGFTLIEVATSIGVVGIIILGAMAYISSQMKLLNQVRTSATGTTIRLNFLSLLQNESSWQNTIQDSQNVKGSFACLFGAGDCTGTQPAFRVLQSLPSPLPSPVPSPPVFYDQVSVPTAGFTEAGASCVGFENNLGNDICPFQVKLNWEPVCAKGCQPKVIKIFGSVVYKPRRTNTFNTQRWDFEIIKNVDIPFLSCAAALTAGASKGDGVYLIDPDGPGPLPQMNVYCDMTNDGGGWTLAVHAYRDDVVGWRTRGPFKLPSTPDPNLTASFKYDDSMIRSLATIAGAYRLEGGSSNAFSYATGAYNAGPFTIKRFAKPSCQYDQIGKGANCGATYATTAWDDPEPTEDPMWAGITDWGNSCPNANCRSFFEASRIHADNYIIGNGQIMGDPSALYCENKAGVDCWMNIWVK